MKRAKPYRAALAGCGRVGFMLERDPLRPKPCTHAGGVVSHPDFRLVAGCDINRERLEDFGKTYGIGGEHLYEDAAEMIERERPDVLCVATWTESHDVIVRSASRAKTPIVICEKPMAVTYARAKTMASGAQRSGTMLLINHSRRWSPEYWSVRRAVEEKRYGDIKHIQGCVLTSYGLGISNRAPGPSSRRLLRKPSRLAQPRLAGATPSVATPSVATWHAILEKSGGGPLLHDGTHLIDIVLYLTNLKPAWVEGRIERAPGSAVEHRAVGRVGFRGAPNLEFHYEAGGARQYFHFEVELWFEAGRIVVGNGLRIVERSAESRRYTGFEDLTVDEGFVWEGAIGTAERVGMEEVAGWLERGVAPRNRAAESLDSQEVIFATYESAVRGRRVMLPYNSRNEHPLLIRSRVKV